MRYNKGCVNYQVLPMQSRTRGRQATPTQTQRRDLLRMLSELAEAGDTNAIGWLLALDELRRRNREDIRV